MLHTEKLIEKARRVTGLLNFGGDSFRVGLERAVLSANAESRMNPRGWAMLEGKLVMLLSNRLRIENWYERYPEIEAQQIVAPLIGLSLPRTGSTALGGNLAEDPAMRSLLCGKPTPRVPRQRQPPTGPSRVSPNSASVWRRAISFTRE